ALMWNGEKVNRVQLEDRVFSLTAGADEQEVVVVHVDRNVSYEVFIGVLDDLLTAGSVASNAKDGGIHAERRDTLSVHLVLEP
ncbi:MAG TPA: hypothetical protein VJ911_03880, partial [Cryomorphaceae bacterium]|nr:hypothetical protein [Cryomorphaceae bacterium]